MEILLAVAVLLLLFFGLRHRKKEEKQWIKEDRFDESGDWLDKRPGERGTFGSLDLEMETDRKDLRRQVKINELSQIFKNYFWENHPDFQNVSDENFRKKFPFLKNEIANFIALAEKMATGFAPADLEFLPGQQPEKHPLKKQVLDFSFENFPKLLDLEIEVIKKLDLAAERLVSKVLVDVV